MTKPDPADAMFKPEYEGERTDLGRERLLTGNLTYLMALEANGMHRAAGQLVEKIGSGLSRRPKQEAIPSGGRITLPDAERGRSAEDLRRLDQINARLARGYTPKRGKSAEEQREEDLRQREELERAIEKRAEAALDRDRAREAEALAQARGEVIASDSTGMRRVLDRDPLLSLARTGKLTALQLEVGQEVRDLYDRRAEDAGAMEYTGMPGGGHDHERFVSKRFERAKACEMIGRIERAIAVNLSAEPAALTMIRVVCERGMSVTSQGKGRAYERNCAALARALDVADDVLRRRI